MEHDAFEGADRPNEAAMLETTKVLVSKSRSSLQVAGEACLVHIYPTGPAMGSRFPLNGGPMVLGRDELCDIRIVDESVSRRHACIQADGNDYVIADMQSTNGTFVNGQRVSSRRLQDGDYLHIGNCICRFLAGGNVEAQYHEEIYRLTIVDALTDIYNRRYLLEFLGHELASAARYRRPLSLIMFDADRFKTINDRLGHLGGDFTLREIAGCVKKVIRQEDVFARYGGEEFALIMPEAGREQSLLCAERLRQLVAGHLFRYENQTYQVTISLGVAAILGEDWMTTSEIIRLADVNLHQAKNKGRNRVEG
jgi:diguanylate cyclase (GGDEF)-like protein